MSDLGRVRSFKPRNGRGKRLTSSRLVNGYLNSQGYPRVSFIKNNKHHTVTVHRLVLDTFIGPRPEGMQCRHLNGDRTDNRLENITWGTPSENAIDSVRHKTHPNAILSAEQIGEIRILRADTGMTYRALGAKYGVSESTIWNIAKGETWGHVDD